MVYSVCCNGRSFSIRSFICFRARSFHENTPRIFVKAPCQYSYSWIIRAVARIYLFLKRFWRIINAIVHLYEDRVKRPLQFAYRKFWMVLTGSYILKNYINVVMLYILACKEYNHELTDWIFKWFWQRINCLESIWFFLKYVTEHKYLRDIYFFIQCQFWDLMSKTTFHS